ncbi:hypothetical protein ACFVWG_37700 [Kribbella sp. NPDC058245]|uniref:hypothetical protein n=1 Tax=Kribbella sp. NPDC058245 TaxID=3346399 RepID=UPI0036E17E1A
MAALTATALCIGWIWTRADAVSPAALPSGNPGLRTVDPSVKPTPTPAPQGKVLGTLLVAANKDSMPIMGSAWSETGASRIGLYGGAAIWLTVHENYNSDSDWGNVVAFGQLTPTVKVTSTPAGLKSAATQAGSRAIIGLYGEGAKISATTHKAITVDGHPGHEITTRVAVSAPKLTETFSTVLIAVVDRGDGTAAVSIGDIAGSTPTWIQVWRTKVSQIKINR